MKAISRVWSSPDNVYRLVVQPKAWRALTRLCDRAADYETGGILVGYYSDDLMTAIVTEATPPPKDSAAGHTWFHRGVAGLQRLLAVRWARLDRRYYLGEWHYHPAMHVEPSHSDISQMVQISQAKHYNCPEPIMLITGRNNGGEQCGRAFVFPRSRAVVELMPVS
jgi:hypothetical protein